MHEGACVQCGRRLPHVLLVSALIIGMYVPPLGVTLLIALAVTGVLRRPGSRRWAGSVSLAAGVWFAVATALQAWVLTAR